MKHSMQITTPNEREILMTRTFNAPKELVFDAYTQPALLKRWLGVHSGWSLALCEVDLKVGGAYRYVWHGPDQVVMGMGGIFQEIVPGERLVATERFDHAWYAGEGLSIVTLTEQNGRTALSLTLRYESTEVRDAVLKTPMGKGVEASLNKLEEVVSSPQSC